MVMPMVVVPREGKVVDAAYGGHDAGYVVVHAPAVAAAHKTTAEDCVGPADCESDGHGWAADAVGIHARSRRRAQHDAI